MIYETGICCSCGVDQGLHRFDTMQCPRHGIEETRFDKLAGKFFPQQYADTIFEDSGLRKLHDAAPEILEALQNIVSCNGVGYKDVNKFVKDLQPFIKKGQQAIKKAR